MGFHKDWNPTGSCGAGAELLLAWHRVGSAPSQKGGEDFGVCCVSGAAGVMAKAAELCYELGWFQSVTLLSLV